MSFAAFIQQHVTDVIPVAGLWIITNSMNTHVFCQLHIGNAITDHIYEFARDQCGLNVYNLYDAEFRFAAGTVFMWEVRTISTVPKLHLVIQRYASSGLAVAGSFPAADCQCPNHPGLVTITKRNRRPAVHAELE